MRRGICEAELTFDGVHLYAQHYDKWRDFLFEHGVEKEEQPGSLAETDGHGRCDKDR